MCVYVCVLCVQRQIYFVELAHVIVGPGKPKLCRASLRPRDASMLQLELESLVEAEVPPPGTSVFLRPSTDWVRPTHTVQGSLLYSRFNVNLV